MVILGIDPGLATLGFGVIEYEDGKLRLIDYGTVVSPAKMELPARLEIVYDSMGVLFDRFQPQAVAFEELFFAKNVTTAINVAQARGAAVAALYKKTRALFEYTPPQVKQAVVGYGNADKRQVQNMVKAILHLSEIPKPDDAADAVAIAICHANSSSFSHSFKM